MAEHASGHVRLICLAVGIAMGWASFFAPIAVAADPLTQTFTGVVEPRQRVAIANQGGTRLYPAANRLDRETALRLWTEANTWFSNEEGKKGQIKVGQLADLAVLSDDYFAVPESEIVHLRSVLTVLGGKVVHGEGDYGPLAPALPAPMPDWSPVATFGGYYRTPETQTKLAMSCGCAHDCSVHGHDHAAALGANVPASDARSFWGAFGCGCWAM